jgi:hypothetical protein
MAISMFKTFNTNQETKHCFLCFRDTLDIEFISITVCGSFKSSVDEVVLGLAVKNRLMAESLCFSLRVLFVSSRSGLIMNVQPIQIKTEKNYHTPISRCGLC